MITLRQLRYLEAVARLGHFGRAAEECAVSQPALSMQIQDLETDLGVALIERGRGAIRPTALGAEVVERARAILADVHDLEAIARRRGRLLAGRLTLGVIPSIAPYLLPAVLPRLGERYPELQLELRETLTRNLVADLVQGRLDAVLLSLPIDEPGVETLDLFGDAFRLVVPAGDALAGAGRLSGGDLPQERLLLLEEGHCLRDQALAFCGAPVGEWARPRLGATSLATIVQMVANGYGVTLVPEIALPVEVRADPRIAVVPFEAPQPTRRIGLAWRSASPRGADYHALGAVVAEAGTEILAQIRDKEAA